MNCPEWEARVLRSLDDEADAATAAHLQECPACAAFARELTLDARQVRVPPREAAVIDYPALRAAAWREAGGRRRRQKIRAILAAAAAVFLASFLVLHRDRPGAVPHAAHRPSAPPAVPEVARDQEPRVPVVAPTVPPRPALRPDRARRRIPDADLDRQFAEYLRSVDESRRAAKPLREDSPVIARITTENPRVTILLLQESKGNSHD